MEKLLVTIPKGHIRDTFLPPDTAARLETLGEVIWNDSERQLTEKELEEKIPGVTVLVTGWGTPGLSEAVLQKADALKIVAHTGGTVAKLTPFSVFERGIRVLSGNDIYAESVAESVIAYALTALRDIPKYQDQLLKDGWSHPDWYNEGLLDQPVGLVGFGAVARHTVKLLKPFRNPIKVWADFLTPADEEAWGIKKVTAEEVFSTSKIVSIHTSLTDETFHSINSRLLKLLPDGALFFKHRPGEHRGRKGAGGRAEDRPDQGGAGRVRNRASSYGQPPARASERDADPPYGRSHHRPAESGKRLPDR